MTRLWTVDELVEQQGPLSKDTVYDWLRSGELVGVKLGVAWRIHPDDWQAFVDARRNARRSIGGAA